MNKIFILFLGVFLLISPLIMAEVWPLNKQQTCALFNKSVGLECELYWCNEIQEGNYSFTKEVCIFNETFIINETIIINGTNMTNYTNFNETNYWNITKIKEYVDNLTGNLRDNLLNVTSESKIREIASNEAEKIRSYSSQVQEEIPTWLILVVIIAIFGLVIILVVFKTKETRIKKDEAKQFRKKFILGNQQIVSSNQQPIQQPPSEIERLQKQIEKLEKELSEKINPDELEEEE